MPSPAVLFVAGDTRVRTRLEPLIRAAGLCPSDVSSGSEARAALRMLVFPVVIVDRALDDADGVDLCHEIRRLENQPGAYILLVSGYASADDIAKALAAGADDCLSTHASDAELLEQLSRATYHCISLKRVK